MAGCERAAPSGSTPPPKPAAATAAHPTAPPGPPEKLHSDLTPMYRLIEQQHTGAARVRLRKYLTVHPDDGQAEFLFGLTYHREKLYGKARVHFEKALETAPDYDPVHYFLGWALYYLGEMEEARRSFERHLVHRPDAGDSHFALGLIDLEDDRLDDAAAEFRRAIELNESHTGRSKELSKAHARLADVLIRRSEFDRAKHELTIATDLYPDHYEAYYKLSRVLARLGETEAAEEAKRKFMESRHRVHPEAPMGMGDGEEEGLEGEGDLKD